MHHDSPEMQKAGGETSVTEVLDALAQQAAPLAVADTAGRLVWFSAGFAALWLPAPGLGARLADLHAGLAAGLQGGQPGWASEVSAPDGRRFSLVASPSQCGQTVIRGDLLSAPGASAASDERLRERLDLVQEFSDTGIFERDVPTLQGTWDRHMYRIYGLPDASPAAPGYAVTSEMIFSEDRKPGAFQATFAHHGPHEQRLRMRRADGEVRHLLTRWKVFFDAHGTPTRVLGTNTDTTDAVELATRAERLHTELQVALELGRIALWRHDLASGLVYYDERGSGMLGVPHRSDGLSLVDVRRRIHPDDIPLAKASAVQTLRTGEPSDIEMRLRHPDGGWRHVLARRALQHGADGSPLGFIGVLMDVTDRVEESRRALESARRLDAAAGAARIGLWSTRLGTRVPSWNRRMYEMFGLDPTTEPLPLEDWLARCVHDEDRPRVLGIVIGWWKTGEGEISIEFRIVRPSDGALRFLLVRGRIDAVGPGPSMRAEGIALDITEQQQTLRQLHETVERMSLTTQALGLGTWSGNLGHREVRWDAQMFRLRGVQSGPRAISAEEIVSYLHPDDRAQIVANQLGRVRDGQPWHNVFRVLWPDGSLHWITSHSVPMFDAQGQLEGRIGVNWDSTESHLAAEALHERELAVAESQAKSQAMSRISHELRTPLNAILGFTQLLRLAQDDPDTQKRSRWLAHTENAGRHLLALIDDVLELARAEAGELKVERKPVAWAAVIAEALPLVTGLAQDRSVAIHQAQVTGVVLGDPVRLRQVLINLLSNAIKYNRAGGEVRLWVEPGDQRVSLHVADTGPGMAPDRLRHAFEPFNRLGAESTDVDGSGIGLTIVKALVEQMAGAIEVRSQPGQGSEFIVRLPAAAAGSHEPVRTGPGDGTVVQRGTVAKRSSVLYIEDNEVNALLVRELLEQRPAVQLEIAANGRIGVRMAAEKRPDLVLIDMQLPDIDGHAVFNLLQADTRTAGVPCVALSANATPADLDAAIGAGFTEYWTKPIDVHRFLESVDRMLGL